MVWTPFATLINHDAAGEEERRDSETLRRDAGADEDPAFSPWYSKDRSEPIPVPLAKLPEARGGRFPEQLPG